MTNIPDDILEIIKDIIAQKELEKEEIEQAETNLEYLYDYDYSEYLEHDYEKSEPKSDKIIISL